MWGNIRTATESLVVEVRHPDGKTRSVIPIGRGIYHLGRADDGELGMGNTLLEAISRWGSRREVIYGLYLFEERRGVLRIRDIIAEGYFPWVSRYHLRLDVSGGRLRITKRRDSAPVTANDEPFTEAVLNFGGKMKLRIGPVKLSLSYTLPGVGDSAVERISELDSIRKGELRLIIENAQELLKTRGNMNLILRNLVKINKILGDEKFRDVVSQVEYMAEKGMKPSEDTVRIVGLYLERMKEKLDEEDFW